MTTFSDNLQQSPHQTTSPVTSSSNVVSSAMANMSSADAHPFPFHRLIPKRETGADVFVQRYPDHDGRGVTIAIIDSGVDPGAAGLKQTTNGLPKIVDVRDFSGSGDIDTTRIASLQQFADNSSDAQSNSDAGSNASRWYVTGISEKRLLFPANWPRPNSNNQVHLGIVKLYDLASPDVQREWKQKRKEQVWAPRHSKAHADVLESKKLIGVTNSKENVTTVQREREEADAALDVLDWFDRKFSDYGPIFDVLCYEDEAGIWRAAIDTSHVGDLSQTTLLTNFRDEQKYGSVGGIYQLNYVINILCNGNKLEIVVPQSHGTHVASIAAACFPDQPERNGIAPGAQIVSLKIGHSLLDGSFETGYSLVRAIDYCCKNNIMLANVSYGEPYSWADGGCVHEAVERAVRDYGVIMCVAAGNEGPCLNTILSMPANMWTFAVSAYVTPDMGKVLYGLSHTGEPMPYNWTSRAPSLENSNPILCCAPGAAQAAVPTYYLMRSELMNGTSMASPNACGNIALMLSACKALNIRWSPCSVRRAIMNTAQFDSRYMERLACGNGLIRPCEALEWLQKYANESEWNVEFQCWTGKHRGIYLRSRHALIDQVHTMNVSSLFSRNHESDQHQFELPCRLECDASPWLAVPEQLTLTNGPRPFKIELYTSRLRSPGIHYSEIRAYDARNYSKGVLFKVPVTVILPHYKHTDWNVEIRHIAHQPGVPVRNFFDIPPGATYADIALKLSGCDEEHSGPADATATVNFELGIMQTIDKLHFQSAYTAERLSLGAGRVVRYQVAVNDRLSFLELATVMFWSRMYHARIDIDLHFHGLSPQSDMISFTEGDRYYRLDLLSGARMENLAPAASLGFLVMPTKPYESHIEAILEERDMAPDGSPMYALNLFYKFTLNKSSNVLIVCPLLMDYLYENEFHSQLWKVFDARKVRVALGDAKIARRYDYAVKLDKGDYTVVMQVRHRSRARLAKLDELPVYVRIKLASPVQLELYGSYLDALKDDSARKVTTKALMPNSTFSCFISHAPGDKLPKNLHNGNYLEGQLHLMKEFAAAPNNAGKKVTCLPLRYYCYESRKGKPVAGGTVITAANFGGAHASAAAATAAVEQLQLTNSNGSVQQPPRSPSPAPAPPMMTATTPVSSGTPMPVAGISEATDVNLSVTLPAGTSVAAGSCVSSNNNSVEADRQEEVAFNIMLSIFDKMSSAATASGGVVGGVSSGGGNESAAVALRQHYEYMMERFVKNKNATSSEAQSKDDKEPKHLQREKLTITLAHSYLAGLFSATRAQFPVGTASAQYSAIRLRILSTQQMHDALAVCDQLIKSIDQAEVLAYMGSKINSGGQGKSLSTSGSSSPASCNGPQARDAVVELKKAALIDALLYKGYILASEAYAGVTSSPSDKNAEESSKTIDDILEQLSRYVESKDSRSIALHMQQARMRKQYRKCLKLCTQLYDENATEEVHQLMLELLAEPYSTAVGAGGSKSDWSFLTEWWRDAKAATFAPSWEPF